MGKLVANLLKRWGSPAAEPDPVTLDGLATELAKMRGEMANLQLQWAEVLDKIAAWGNRVAARERKRVRASLDELEGETPTPDDEPSGPAPAPPQLNGPRGNSKAELYARMNQRLRR